MHYEDRHESTIGIFFNDEAYGIRSIHAHLIDRKVDARMMFMKLPRYHGESQEEKVKGHFIGKINVVSEKEIELFVEHVIANHYDLVDFSLVSQHGNYRNGQGNGIN